MEIDEVSDGIIYKAPCSHPAAQPKKHGADNAEVSGSNPGGLSGKTDVYPSRTGLIEQN